MADGGVGILPKAVEFVLDNWTVLQLAVEHGFGGIQSREKVVWLKDVIAQVLINTHKVEYEELEDYISEILYNEFDTVVEDGSLEKISQKLCQFQILWRAGNTESIQKEIESVTPIKLSHPKKDEEEENDCEEDMEEPSESSQQCSCEGSSSSMSCHHCNSIQEGIGNLSIASNSEEMPQSRTEVQNDEDEEGWEVVRRSKRH